MHFARHPLSASHWLDHPLQLAIKALYKMDQPSAIAGLVAAAQQAVPGLASDFAHLAAWMHETVEEHPKGREGAAQLLARRTFLSCVDLQVCAGMLRRSALNVGLASALASARERSLCALLWRAHHVGWLRHAVQAVAGRTCTDSECSEGGGLCDPDVSCDVDCMLP